MNEESNYLAEYSAFLEKFQTQEVSPEAVGLTIVRFASYFASFNLKMVEAQRKLSLVARDIEGRTDDNGKAISSAKAQAFIEATDECHVYESVKANRENVEQFMSALRALQRGMMTEFGMAGNT